MTSPDPLQLLRLFQKVAPAQFFYELCQKQGFGFRQGIYTPAVVVRSNTSVASADIAM